MKRNVMRIAREEWRAWLRGRAAPAGLALLTMLMLVAGATAWDQARHAGAERARYQATVDAAFKAQPDRHPHRMVHYGQFVFRPVNPLAAFDPGVDAFTGNMLFLEGHRQNGANFGDVRQTSLLLRFGQLTPAFVLQVLAPLLLVFFGHAALAREREDGTLRVLLAQGVRAHELVLGKLLALSGFALLMLLPAWAALGGIAATTDAPASSALVLGAAYTAWLLLWLCAVVLVSALCARGRNALLVLLGAWLMLVILVPRGAPAYVQATLPVPTRFEDASAVQRAQLAAGDPHDANDPHMRAFRARILRQYGVARVEDLPVNFKGLAGMEAERRSSALYDRFAAATLNLQSAQNAAIDRFGWVSPLIALRRLSMAASGTDLAGFRRFLEQGERYRFALVQGLNQLQVDQLRYADDTTPGKENRIARAWWRQFPAFAFVAAPVDAMLHRVAPVAAILLAWLAGLVALTWLAGARMGRTA